MRKAIVAKDFQTLNLVSHVVLNFNEDILQGDSLNLRGFEHV